MKDIAGLLSVSDIGVLSSNYEGLPNVAIEYRANGLPVIAADLPDCRKVFGDGPQQQLCRAGDPDILATRLHVLLHDPDLL